MVMAARAIAALALDGTRSVPRTRPSLGWSSRRPSAWSRPRAPPRLRTPRYPQTRRSRSRQSRSCTQAARRVARRTTGTTTGGTTTGDSCPSFSLAHRTFVVRRRSYLNVSCRPLRHFTHTEIRDVRDERILFILYRKHPHNNRIKDLSRTQEGGAAPRPRVVRPAAARPARSCAAAARPRRMPSCAAVGSSRLGVAGRAQPPCRAARQPRRALWPLIISRLRLEEGGQLH